MKEQERTSSLTASRDSVKKDCYVPIKHNKQRRKRNHDYTSVALYLITVTTVDRQRILGKLVGKSAAEAEVEATDLGKKVIACFKRIPDITMEKTGCRVQVVQYQLMPDHFHGVLYVKDMLPKEWPLGQIISGWKGACTRVYRQAFALSREAGNELKPELNSDSMNETLLCSDTDYETAEMIGSKMLMHMAMAYRMIKGDEHMKL